jgi:hypothetical protein
MSRNIVVIEGGINDLEKSHKSPKALEQSLVDQIADDLDASRQKSYIVAPTSPRPRWIRRITGWIRRIRKWWMGIVT